MLYEEFQDGCYGIDNELEKKCYFFKIKFSSRFQRNSEVKSLKQFGAIFLTTGDRKNIKQYSLEFVCCIIKHIIT